MVAQQHGVEDSQWGLSLAGVSMTPLCTWHFFELTFVSRRLSEAPWLTLVFSWELWDGRLNFTTT